MSASLYCSINLFNCFLEAILSSPMGGLDSENFLKATQESGKSLRIRSGLITFHVSILQRCMNIQLGKKYYCSPFYMN